MIRPHFFISYSRSDASIVNDLIPVLREVYGYEYVWLDANLYGGQEWWQAILEEIRNCNIFLYLLSNKSASSQYCQAELTEAERLHKQIIPMICKRTPIPATLSHLQIIDISEGVKLHTFAHLASAIQSAIYNIPDNAPPPLSDAPTPLPTSTQAVSDVDYRLSPPEFEYDPKLTQFLDPVAEEVVKRLKTISRIRVKQNLRSGQSGSQVLLVDVDPLADFSTPVGPHYLKIHSDAEIISNLLGSLQELARTPIRVAMPVMADHAIYQNRLAVLYTPAQSGRLSAKDVISLADLFKTDLSASVDNIVGLMKLLQEWNNRPQIRTLLPYDILVHLLGEKRVRGPESVQKRVFELLQIPDQPLRILFGGQLVLPNPMAFLSKEVVWQNTGNQAIVIPVGHTHGDLHANNLICQRRSRTAAGDGMRFPDILDFATYDREKLIFFDLAYLEFDILTRICPLIQRENRSEMILLLPYLMDGDDITISSPIPGGQFAYIIPELLRPLRTTVESYFGHRTDDFKVAFWLAATAVGLNFARKRTPSVNRYDNLFGVMYAAAALKNVLNHFDISYECEAVPYVLWANGKEAGE